MALVQRFVDAIRGVAPIETVSGVVLILTPLGLVPTVEQEAVQFTLAATATPQERDAAAAVVVAFDWSQAADRAYELARARSAAGGQLAADEGQLIRALAYVILDEINLIRGALVPPLNPRTRQQLKTAVEAALQAGAADT